MTAKITAIRRIVVRETGVSRHHGGPIESLTETSRTSQHSIVLRDFREALNWAPIMPRDASDSDSHACECSNFTHIVLSIKYVNNCSS